MRCEMSVPNTSVQSKPYGHADVMGSPTYDQFLPPRWSPRIGSG